MFEYNEASEKAVEYLDTKDLSENIEYLRSCRSELSEIREDLSRLSNEIARCLDCLTDAELLIYLCDRYNIHYSEYSTYYIY